LREWADHHDPHDTQWLNPLNGAPGSPALATTTWNEGSDGCTAFENPTGTYKTEYAKDTFFLVL
jgi:hypothetical protein